MPTPRSDRSIGRGLATLAAALTALGGADRATASEKPPQPVTRCGWFQNPTPGNAWLADKDGQWIIGIQGGHQAEGDWPDFHGRGWVHTNRSYGYGCACMRVLADAPSREVQRILSATVRPLEACRQDSGLPKPGA